nr:unnamed protein product [Callosobruchus chinensis]
MQNSVTSEQLGVNDVLELLQQEYAIISGGKSKEGCPIITFPDKSNFEMLSDTEYQRLMLYLTSVPSRNDKWNSVKAVLLKISVYFPGLVHVVYVLRPASFIQKALSEVSNKLFKDEFKFRMIVLSTTEELHKYVSVQQLTPDLGGSLPYNHEDWIQQRIELETFSAIAQQISNSLDDFTKTIEEGELPNDVDSTQQLLDKHTLIYSDLKKEILSVAKHGEDLLSSIKEKKLATYGDESQFCDPSGNIFAVERLLVQLEGTEQAFDNFWQELQVKFESHLKTISDAVESGDTVESIDQLIKQTKVFEKLCTADVDRADEVISSGQHLVSINSCPRECVEPKCTELIRVRNLLLERLAKRIEALTTTRTLLERIDNVSIFRDMLLFLEPNK